MSHWTDHTKYCHLYNILQKVSTYIRLSNPRKLTLVNVCIWKDSSAFRSSHLSEKNMNPSLCNDLPRRCITEMYKYPPPPPFMLGY